jgi:TolB-like protein/Tfp pilus assembly protein PilF
MFRYTDAVAIIKKGISLAGRGQRLVTLLGIAYALSGEKDKAEMLLQELQERAKSEYVSPIYFAKLHANLGNTNEAVEYLKKACQERNWFVLFLRHAWIWDKLRDDPGFNDVLAQMNFPKAPVSGTSAKPEEATQEPIEKIAVLPFTSISSDTGEEWFVDGMTDALITQLGKIKALTVISRTSAMQYKNVSKPMREIAQDLGVDALVEGSVIRAGNNVEIIARLIDGRTDERIWGDFFPGTFSDILALQSQVTLAIAREIQATLTPDEEKRIARTEAVNPEAYVSFLKGRFFFFKFTEEGFKSATKYLEDAIEIDPNYAQAYAWLASAYWCPSIWGYSRPEESFSQARSAANRAMDLDETLAMAYGSVGWIALGYDWDWQKAKESFERARELNPNDPDAYHGLAWYFVVAGHFDEALEMMQTAVKLDPLSCAYNNHVAWMYFDLGLVERAIVQRKKALELDPGYVEAFSGLAEDYLRLSMYPEAIASVERAMSLAGRRPHLVTLLGRAYALSGRKDEAETLLQELHKRAVSEYVLPTYFSGLYASLGNMDVAFRWLEKGYQERNWEMLFLRISQLWDPLRSDPRFDDFVRRMKYPE